MVFRMCGLFTNMRIIILRYVTDTSHPPGFDDPNNIG